MSKESIDKIIECANKSYAERKIRPQEAIALLHNPPRGCLFGAAYVNECGYNTEDTSSKVYNWIELKLNRKEVEGLYDGFDGIPKSIKLINDEEYIYAYKEGRKMRERWLI